MFGSKTLDIVIGLTFFFLFASLICSAIREGLESYLKMRALDLERGIREILNDPGGKEITKALFDHPMISALFPGKYDPGQLKDSIKSTPDDPRKFLPRKARRDLPSYIPAANFAQALLSMVAQGTLIKSGDPKPVDTSISAANIRAGIAKIENDKVKQALLSAFDLAKGDIDATRANLEIWFNSSMDRVSGWYKRRTQLFLFLIGLVAAVALNLDAINVTKHLTTDDKFRDAVVAAAVATVKTDIPPADLDKQSQMLTDLGFPIGWPAVQTFRCNTVGTCDVAFGATVQMLLGWLITAIAVMFGAPFWFDVLNKLVGLRSAGKEPPKDGGEVAGAKK